MFEVLV